MKRLGKIKLFSPTKDRILTVPRSEVEFSSVRKYYGDDIKKISSLGWGTEDYRQSVVGSSIENAIAKPEDFLPFPFRHLTATIVGGGSWKATEFSDKVLKAAAKMLSFKPVFVNHEMETSNLVAVNGEIKFVPKKGNVPGGLEGAIWVDGMLHQDITRKLSAYPVPHIQSVSVTVSYEWEPSHAFTNADGDEDEWLFERRIGTMVDGKMVRRVVTKIIDFYETSFVWLGADPYAKVLDVDGNPINVERSAVVGKSAFDKDPLVNYYKSEGLILVEDSTLSSENIATLKANAKLNFGKTGNFKEKTEKINTDMDERFQKIIDALAKKLNKSADEITEDMVAGYELVAADKMETFKTAVEDAKESKVNADKVVELTKKVDEYGKIVEFDKLEELSKEVALDELVSTAKYGKSAIKAKRDRCVQAYKLKVGEDKVNEAVVKNIEECSLETLNGLLEQYGEDAYEGMGAICTKCDSGEHITFKSTDPEGEGEIENGEDDEFNRMAYDFRF